MLNESNVTEAKSVQREPGLTRRFLSFKATQITLLSFSILEILIALRIILKLIGANPDNPIVALIYGFTAMFLIPFVGLIKSPTTGGMILETSSIFAIVIYALTAVAFEKLIWVIFSRPRSLETSVTETTINDNQTMP
ncbi:MAG: YggT family protein [Chloroflexota bacterium]